MKASQKAKAKRTARASESLGLAANGSSGTWYVDVDHTTSQGPEKWYLEIDGPIVNLRFEIVSPEAIGRMLLFFEGRGFASLKVGNRGVPVELLRDDEFPDRFWFLVGRPNATVRVCVAGESLSSLQDAFKQVQEDLADGGYV